MTAEADRFADMAKSLLPQAAALSLTLSRQLCRHGGDAGDCADYHGIRPFLLWFGLGTGPWPQKDFFRNAMADAVREGARRILISGAADYQIPALALWAAAAAGLVPDITVVDLCETPLRLCTWFAERMEIEIKTRAGDILSYRTEQPFDVIFVHSFLGYFPPASWAGLIAAWHGALAAGGRVILVNRIRPNAPEKVGFSPAQEKDFHARFLVEAARHADEIAVSPERVASLTSGYAAYSAMYSLRSVEALTARLEAGGFRIATLEVDPPDPASQGASLGPTLAGSAKYVKLVAIKH